MTPQQKAEKVEELVCWYCPTCKKELYWNQVTYEETHDERYGGCGGLVVEKAVTQPSMETNQTTENPNQCGDLLATANHYADECKKLQSQLSAMTKAREAAEAKVEIAMEGFRFVRANINQDDIEMLNEVCRYIDKLENQKNNL